MTAHRIGQPTDYDTWSSSEVGEAAGITPGQIVHFARSRLWLIVLVTGVCLLGAMVFQLVVPPRYVATAQIIVDPRELQNVSADVSPRADNADANVAMVENEMRVLKSNTLLSQLVDKEDLTHDPEFVHQPSQFINTLLKLVGDAHPAAEASDAKNAVIQELDRAIAVRRTERSFVIDISMTTNDPDKSARLANSLVTLYIAQASAARADLTKRVSDGLQGRLSELQKRARDADDRVEKFRTDNNLVSTNGLLTSDQTLRDLNNQLVIARTQEDQDRAKLEQIQRLRNVGDVQSIPEAIQSPTIVQLRNQLAEVRRKRGALAEALGPRHPDFIAATKELEALQRLLSEELGRIAQSTRNQYARSKENEASLQRTVDSLSQAALNNSKSMVRLRELERDAQASRELFTSFLARSRELSEQTRLYTTDVRQIGIALPPLTKANLPGTILMAGALVGGLLLGCALAVLLGLRDLYRGRPGTDVPRRWQRA